MASQPVHYYGAKRDSPDPRDYKMKEFASEEIPSKATTELRVPFVYNQGHLGSCTANAVCAAYAIDLEKEGKQVFIPSRLFVYYNTRVREETVCEDSGATLRETVKAFAKLGVCYEERPRRNECPRPFWSYDRCKTRFKQKPPPECYGAAKGNTVCRYESLKDHTKIDQIRACLDQEYPLVFSFQVFKQSFEKKARVGGIMCMPGPDDTHVDNHAVVAVGYNDARKRVTVLNSWGVHWGHNGYFYMPYDFITNEVYCFDFWKIEFANETTSKARLAPVKTEWAYGKTDEESSLQDPSPARHRLESRCCTCTLI